MRQSNHLAFMFITTLMAMVVWLLSPNAQALSKSTEASIAPLPFVEYEASYKIAWHGITMGESSHRLLRRTDGLYHIESKTIPYLKFVPFRYVEKTDFAWINGQARPKNYMYDIQEGKRLKKGRVVFDWKKKRVANTIGQEPWDAEIPDGLQDKLTHGLMLRKDLKEGKTPLVYQVAEDDEIKSYTFVINGHETIATPFGSFATIQVKHEANGDRITYLWLAPELDYLTIKMEQYRKGKRVLEGSINHYAPKVQLGAITR